MLAIMRLSQTLPILGDSAITILTDQLSSRRGRYDANRSQRVTWRAGALWRSEANLECQ
jgi:hypothetical protein